MLGALVFEDLGQESHGILEVPELIDVLNVKLSADNVLDESHGPIFSRGLEQGSYDGQEGLSVGGAVRGILLENKAYVQMWGSSIKETVDITSDMMRSLVPM